MKTNLIGIIPVLPSSNIERDVQWYVEQAGFNKSFIADGYAGVSRENIHIHLQWHAGTTEDPLLGGSIVKIFVNGVEALFNEFVERGTVAVDALQKNTPWGTNEFGFYDQNNNAVLFVEIIA